MKENKCVPKNKQLSKKESNLMLKTCSNFVKNNNSISKLKLNKNYWSNIDEIIEYYNNR